MRHEITIDVTKLPGGSVKLSSDRQYVTVSFDGHELNTGPVFDAIKTLGLSDIMSEAVMNLTTEAAVDAARYDALKIAIV
jgi:hypothetical protein